MLNHDDIDTPALRQLIRSGQVTYAGNRKLGIFGTLSCASGKRMARSTRVFFADVDEATHYGFRPCGHCMRNNYKQWKKRVTSNGDAIHKV